MKDLYLKRNELCKKSMIMRIIKFDLLLKKKQTFNLNREQTKVFNHFNFYDKYIKALNKEKEERK